MSHQLPVILFLLPLFAAISMPVVCLKHRHWSQPISVAILAAMVLVSILNLHNIIHHGEVRYVFSGWAVPLGIEWVADGLASVTLVLLSGLGLLGVVFAGRTSPKALARILHELKNQRLFFMSRCVFAGSSVFFIGSAPMRRRFSANQADLPLSPIFYRHAGDSAP